MAGISCSEDIASLDLAGVWVVGLLYGGSVSAQDFAICDGLVGCFLGYWVPICSWED